ncbi:hypothetical protein ABZ958_07575 [Streptomyces sp. NPDC046237]|uniref:hypothetical protein n=1 Tax=Streptomyces sp. NPDC046237 TaxID=3154914 RepID=UPI003404F22B
MSDDTWAAITSRDTVVLLAALAVYLGRVVGFAGSLPRLMLKDAEWRRDTGRDPASSALTLTLLVVLWPASLVYVWWRIVARRRGPTA